MNDQMIRVISSPSSSTTGFLTLILVTGGRCYRARRPRLAPARTRRKCHNRDRWQPRSAPAFGNHEVVNQPPPLVDYNVFEATRSLVEAVRREGAEWAERADRRRRRVRRQRRGPGAGPARQRERAEAAHPRPLRQPGRRGRVPPRLARAAGRRGRLRAALLALEGPAAGRPRRPRRRLHVHVAGRGRDRLPDLDDLLGDPGAAHAARAGRRVGAALPLRRLRPGATPPPHGKTGALAGMGMTEKQGGTDVRANTTVARPVNGGGPGAEYELTGHKWFMSAPHVRRLPRPRPGRRRHLLLPLPALDARRRAQPLPPAAAARTSSATAPTPPARSSSTPPRPGWSARRAPGCGRSSRWSTTPASTA